MMTGLALLAVSTACGAVRFVECPKCENRMRISSDGKEAFVNLSRIKVDEREAMTRRAESFLELAKPVAANDKRNPLMGWSSWNTFRVQISEEIIMDIARAMATNGLKDAGYVYVNIDDGFFNGHGADGRLRFHPMRFPNGMKGTVDGIHALGLKAGIYSDAGSNTCGSIWSDDSLGRGSGLYGHDAEDCRLHFNELGFDFIKVDYCGAKEQKLDERERYTEISKAIRATGCDVRFNICRWAFPGTWAADIAESWRTTEDIRASWGSLRKLIGENLYLSAYARPGHFNDMDMLEVGQLKGTIKTAFGESDTGLTRDEETTHFGMWCILSSPLLIGCDIRKIDKQTMSLITNPFLLRMNQDGLGLQAYVVRCEADAFVLVRDADERFGRSRYVAFYNSGDSEHEFSVDAAAFDLGGRVEVFDLVARADPGGFTDSVSLVVAPHAARFFRFDAEHRLERTVYEAETARLGDYQELRDAKEAGTPELLQNPAASGGIAVAGLGNRESNDLTWDDVCILNGGRREFAFRCAAPEKRNFYLQVDATVPRKLAVEASAEGFATVTAEVELGSDVHRVRLFNPSEPMPTVDRLTIRPIKVCPSSESQKCLK